MLAPHTPSFAYTPSPGASDLCFMRGLSIFSSGVHFEPGVGQIFSGFFATRGRLGCRTLIDMAQIEMLKGPQGAIIGKNTSLAAIDISSNKPTEEFEGLAAGSCHIIENGIAHGFKGAPGAYSWHPAGTGFRIANGSETEMEFVLIGVKE